MLIIICRYIIMPNFTTINPCIGDLKFLLI